jgi:hypothetical protein
MRIKTTVGQVAMVGGARYDLPGGILIEQPTSRFGRGRDRGSLYVLLELSGPATGREILTEEMLELARDVYYGQRGSVTAGLQKAVREINNLLLEENEASLPGEQRDAGITCVVLRDDDLFVAQAGPAALFLAQDGRVTRYPDLSPWLDDVSAEDMDATPLGGRREVHVDLFHSKVRRGDVALLVDAGLAAALSAHDWSAILASPLAPDLLGNLIATSRGNDLSALVVRLDEEPTKELAELAQQPSMTRASPQPPARPLWDTASEWLSSVRIGERLRTAAAAVLAALVALGNLLATLLRRMMPEHLDLRPPAATSGDRGRQRQARARKRQKGRAEDRGYSDLTQKILLVVAIAIPVVVAIVVAIVVVRRGQAQRAEVDTLWQNANLSWQQAQAATEPADVRTHLIEAQTYLEQYLDHRPENSDAIELEGKIQARLDEISQVRRISWVGKLKTYPPGADLTRVVVEGVHVFVMDRNAGKVYHHQLDDFQQALRPETADNVLVSKGQQVGGVLVADLVDMVWVPVGEGRQKANLVILESGGSLLQYDPATRELSPLQVAATDLWQFPTLVGSYYGRFYVLDSTANKLWRYSPTQDGYSEPPDDWLQAEVDLLGVVDMAIGNSIYLLYADGRTRKLSAGEPDAFDISDWDVPPQDPSSIFTRPPENTQWVYVADRGNARIVQCAKDGKFKRQLKLADSTTSDGQDPLAAVTNLFVDEIGGHAFFTSGSTLYMIILPE